MKWLLVGWSGCFPMGSSRLCYSTPAVGYVLSMGCALIRAYWEPDPSCMQASNPLGLSVIYNTCSVGIPSFSTGIPKAQWESHYFSHKVFAACKGPSHRWEQLGSQPCCSSEMLPVCPEVVAKPIPMLLRSLPIPHGF